MSKWQKGFLGILVIGGILGVPQFSFAQDIAADADACFSQCMGALGLTCFSEGYQISIDSETKHAAGDCIEKCLLPVLDFLPEDFHTSCGIVWDAHQTEAAFKPNEFEIR